VFNTWYLIFICNVPLPLPVTVPPVCNTKAVFAVISPATNASACTVSTAADSLLPGIVKKGIAPICAVGLAANVYYGAM